MPKANQQITSHPLVGRALHRMDDDDLRNWRFQAHIIDVVPAAVGELLLIQYFSALDGGPTNCDLVPLAEVMAGLKDRSWRLYASVDDMRETGDEMNKRAARIRCAQSPPQAQES